jgi:fatty acid desaturase
MINNKIYDVSGWHEHPGGDVIFTSAGDDATDTFALFHAAGTSKHLAPFLIGKLKEEDRKKWSDERPKGEEQLDFEKGYRRLRLEMKNQGLFKSNFLFYVYKMGSTFLLAVLAAFLVGAFSDDTAAHFAVRTAGAILLGVFFQQCGWLCHEVCHHQVFQDRTLGRFIGYVWGNLAQGFSVGWWMNKHNTHHSVPNVHGDHDGAQNGDPDIDTMPLLAWSRSMLKKATTPMAQWCVKHQAFTYFPLLSVARLSWLQQSIEYAFKPNKHSGRYIAGTDKLKPLPYENVERASLVAHYAWYFAIAFSCPSVFDAVWFVAISNISCGLSLALVFGLGHNGMAVYDAAHRPDYWKLQVTTTRNVKQDRFGFVHWFCGGLDYQVEHHLFPTVPRHNLAATNKLVQKFCKEYGVTYHETTIWDGTVEVLNHLQAIATEMHEEFPAM